nr:MAG TPA: hypothetical protein [Caudoviricetes sp.]
MLSKCKDGVGCHTSLCIWDVLAHTRLCIPLNRVGQITRYLVDFNRLSFYA